MILNPKLITMKLSCILKVLKMGLNLLGGMFLNQLLLEVLSSGVIFGR